MNTPKNKTISIRKLIDLLAAETRIVDTDCHDHDRVLKGRIRKRIEYAIKRKKLTPDRRRRLDYEQAKQWAGSLEDGKKVTPKAIMQREIGRRAFGVFKTVVNKASGIDSRPAGMAELETLLKELPADAPARVIKEIRSLFERALAERDALRLEVQRSLPPRGGESRVKRRAI